MRREAGQAFILVLIFMAVGALVIGPSLSLGQTALKSRTIHGRLLMEQYTADAALEDAMWRLLYEPGFVECVTNQDPLCTDPVPFTLNGTTAEAEIVIKTPTGLGGVAPDVSTKYKRSLTVCPNGVDDGPNDPCPELVNAGIPTPFTYTLSVQLQDPGGGPLNRIEVILPSGLSYTAGSSGTYPDNMVLSDPSINGQRLRWDTGGISFDYGETKTQMFDASATLSDGYYCAEASIVPGGNVKYAKEARITVGNPPPPPGCPGALIAIEKTVGCPGIPCFVPPGTPTTFTYTITIENVDTVDLEIKEVKDCLPVDFTYVSSSTGGGITTAEPATGSCGGGGTNRQELKWSNPQQLPQLVPINAGQTLVHTFSATATLQDSGIYMNEAWVKIDSPIFEAYTWLSGGAMVPQYDIRVEAPQTTVDTNTVFFDNGIDINSWQQQ
ncbi:MAG: hypothetical protein ACE5IG_05670 [Dehalococcoidia bacterium]